MKKQKIASLLIVLIIIAFIIPQITLAAWWNPFSWGIWNSIFHFQQQTQKQDQYSCKTDADCGITCYWGAVNEKWREKYGQQDCLDGCASIGAEPHCYQGICHTFVLGKLTNDSCIKRDLKYVYNGSTVCASDLKVCPDGSTVARKLPDCQFEQCLVGQTGALNTYVNEKHGYKIDYSQSYSINEIGDKTDPSSCIDLKISASEDILIDASSKAPCGNLNCLFPEEKATIKKETININGKDYIASGCIKSADGNGFIGLTISGVNIQCSGKINNEEFISSVKKIISTFKFTSPIINSQTFKSEKECEEKTGCICSFVTCDYIPEGKTFEEVCGKDFQKGWGCTTKK